VLRLKTARREQHPMCQHYVASVVGVWINAGCYARQKQWRSGSGHVAVAARNTARTFCLVNAAPSAPARHRSSNGHGCIWQQYSRGSYEATRPVLCQLRSAPPACATIGTEGTGSAGAHGNRHACHRSAEAFINDGWQENRRRKRECLCHRSCCERCGKGRCAWRQVVRALFTGNILMPYGYSAAARDSTAASPSPCP